MQTKNRTASSTVVLTPLLVGIALYWAKPLIVLLASLPMPQSSSTASWDTEKWTSNDIQYTSARENIDSDFLRGRITKAYLEDLNAVWTKDEHDSLKLFRWAYARHRARSLHPALPFTAFPGGGAFTEAPASHSYQYTRIRFLTETDFGQHRELKALGRRLLAHTLNDFDVEYALISCFGEYLSADEKIAAISYADRLIQKYPTKPSVYGAKGGIYFSYWMDHRNKQDARDAIKCYQDYLRLAPANHEWRKEAKSTIALLQSRL